MGCGPTKLVSEVRVQGDVCLRSKCGSACIGRLELQDAASASGVSCRAILFLIEAYFYSYLPVDEEVGWRSC